MSIISVLQQHRTGIRVLGELPQPMVLLDLVSRPAQRTVEYAEEHLLTARVTVSFVANRAQFDDARHDAVKRLSGIMNQAYIRELLLAKDEIRAGDASAVLKRIDHLIADMEGRNGE